MSPANLPQSITTSRPRLGWSVEPRRSPVKRLLPVGARFAKILRLHCLITMCSCGGSGDTKVPISTFAPLSWVTRYGLHSAGTKG